MSQAHDTGPSGLESVVVGLLRDVRALARQEMALARHEVQYEIGKILKAVLWFGMAVVLGVIGLFAIAAACGLILFEYTGLPAWACAAIVSVILLGGAWGLVLAGREVVKSVHFVPLRTIRTLVDDAKWIAEWVRMRFV
ncbi:MAG TPA: phage holin family protein [Nitrospiraceae bacterium]|nr:phage holin family protein [Nitrospiraceae bacterium]